MSNEKGCTFPGCWRPHNGKGLCRTHRNQQKAGQELKPVLPVGRPARAAPCKICGKKNYGRGYCQLHYFRKFRAGWSDERMREPNHRFDPHTVENETGLHRAIPWEMWDPNRKENWLGEPPKEETEP